MTVTVRKRRRVEQQLAGDRAWARRDARNLALEIGRGMPAVAFDAMAAGVVLRPEEMAYRKLSTWLYVLDEGEWCAPCGTQVLVTDQRLLCQLPAAQLVSLPWRRVAGLVVDPGLEYVTLDFADGRPLALAGTLAPVLAVGAVAFVYGVPALLVHAGLDRLRG